MASICTRSVAEHSVFGAAAELPKRQIPTCEDVFKAYCWNLKADDTESKILFKRAQMLAIEVKDIYTAASIPSIDLQCISVSIQRLISKARELEKYPKLKRTSPVFQDKYNSFKKLFDVCPCKCYDAGVTERNDCKCPLEKKIPAIEWSFWIDQKTVRQMVIGGIDKEMTKILEKRWKRKHAATKLKEHYSLNLGTEMTDRGEIELDTDDNHDKEFELLDSDSASDNDGECSSVQNRNKYKELCKAVDRCKISNRDACLIANAVIKDLNMLSPATVIDPAKLRRQRIFWRKNVDVDHNDEKQKLQCIGFDGKQDVTLVNASGCRRTIKEEHYVIVSFPGDNYIDHVVPSSSKSEDVAKEILSVINDTNSTESLSALVCDGTNNNTGKSNGIIRRLEESLGRPLQWLVCMLHFNELPFRKYFSTLDGATTTGPSSSSGVIASLLDYDPKDLPIANFLPVSGKVLDVDENIKKDLSWDQLYFLKACLAVQAGRESSPDIQYFQSSQPGCLNHSRWLTKANRILRLYMSKDVSSKSLKRITNFIVNFYGPLWFKIKCNSSCQSGARNLFYFLQLYQELDKADQSIILPVLKNNCYFAYPENILLAAVSDSDEEIRRLAIDKIIEARLNEATDGIRIFDKNNIILNLAAKSYIDMIDWTQCTVTSPPLLSHLSNEQLTYDQPIILPHIPCHSQAVERAIKDITAASSKVYGHQARHGMIIQSKVSRLELPRIDSKADFL